MALKFESRVASAVESQYGIEIREPRILPGDKPGETEYQYTVLVKQKFDGLGFFGTNAVENRNGVKESVSRLLLTPVEILQWIFDLRRKIECPDDDFSFLVEFARGLVSVFESGSSLYTNYRYIVLASEDSLIRMGVKIPVAVNRNTQEQIELAELYVPCRGNMDSEAES